jgi:hypothetical protein
LLFGLYSILYYVHELIDLHILTPKILQSTSTEPFEINEATLDIPKCFVTFEPWSGRRIKETYGGKPLLNVAGKPMFAELAIQSLFQNDGWEARWISPRGIRYVPLTDWKDDQFKNQSPVPFKNESTVEFLANIAKLNNSSYSGCWDVVANKGSEIIFAESKRSKKDTIRQTQVNWLSAALKFGLQPSNFLVVQWTASQH